MEQTFTKSQIMEKLAMVQKPLDDDGTPEDRATKDKMIADYACGAECLATALFDDLGQAAIESKRLSDCILNLVKKMARPGIFDNTPNNVAPIEPSGDGMKGGFNG